MAAHLLVACLQSCLQAQYCQYGGFPTRCGDFFSNLARKFCILDASGKSSGVVLSSGDLLEGLMKLITIYILSNAISKNRNLWEATSLLPCSLFSRPCVATTNKTLLNILLKFITSRDYSVALCRSYGLVCSPTPFRRSSHGLEGRWLNLAGFGVQSGGFWESGLAILHSSNSPTPRISINLAQ